MENIFHPPKGKKKNTYKKTILGEPIEWSLPILRQEIGHTLGMDWYL